MTKDTTARDQTQAVANQFAGTARFRVEVVGSPTIEIPADDDQQAIARYFDICGIRYTSHPVGCERLGEPVDPPAVEDSVDASPAADEKPKRSRRGKRPDAGGD